ncbi:Leucine-rich repeat protein lrrA [Hondaea fermentalgiana]|uniref:Leucine-rich repeat protein lrrA n=1 Tax=Hondaea fermentalgiana TaxID=2315210 RepID=A0A2R5GQ24_9STRA|nr:Leucine-rich repeat protein lrrA [Hondaea fermentalgiana]|eukprot:GBG32967.1 Leucine-rich repeat protein lrrA [Hondaea fermentalgiana]
MAHAGSAGEPNPALELLQGELSREEEVSRKDDLSGEVEPWNKSQERDVWSEAPTWAVPALSLAVQQAKTSRTLHLAFFGLSRLEEKLILSPALSGLVRLDVGHNDLETLPKEVAKLARLEQLWVNDNPRLSSLPSDLTHCHRLRVVDARRTSLRNLPAGLGTLPNLIAIDLRGIEVLKSKLVQAYVPPHDDEEEEGGLVFNNASSSPQAASSPPTTAASSDPTSSASTLRSGGTLTECRPQHAETPLLAEVIARTRGLKSYLLRRQEIKELKGKLREKLCSGLYRDLSETEAGRVKVVALIKEVSKVFPEPETFADVIRNCDRLFPDRIARADVRKIRQEIDSLKRQNERKKLAAKLELRLRALYFDRINPALVEGIVHSLYAEISELADVQFLIRHAAQLFPERADQINAVKVFQNLRALQERLALERAEAVEGVLRAMVNLYSHVDPPVVRKAAEAVCAPFRKVEELKKLAADASQYFPTEFEQCATRPRQVRLAFVGESNN